MVLTPTAYVEHVKAILKCFKAFLEVVMESNGMIFPVYEHEEL